jgi:hypothetical protein
VFAVTIKTDWSVNIIATCYPLDQFVSFDSRQSTPAIVKVGATSHKKMENSTGTNFRFWENGTS